MEQHVFDNQVLQRSVLFFDWRKDMYDYYSFPVEHEVLSALLRKAEQAMKERFTFLLVGRTGVGKSSTVNSLMNKRAARVGNYEATTKEVKAHEYEAFGIRFVVVDTPGLCDDLEEGSNDENYVELIRRDVEKFDCLWFVTRLDETRVSGDEKRAIKVITKAFGPQTWEHAIIVFTFANSLGPDIPYHEACETRAVLIRKEIAKWVKEQDIVDSIPAVPVDNKKRETPDGQPWLGDLYATVIERISNRGFLPFFLATYKMV